MISRKVSVTEFFQVKIQAYNVGEKSNPWGVFLGIFQEFSEDQKQPPRGVPRKRCSKNIQQICRRTPMPKCNYNKVAKELY